MYSFPQMHAIGFEGARLKCKRFKAFVRKSMEVHYWPKWSSSSVILHTHFTSVWVQKMCLRSGKVFVMSHEGSRYHDSLSSLEIMFDPSWEIASVFCTHLSAAAGWWEILMPKRVCTYVFPGNDEFSIDFPEEKEAARGHKKVSTNFSFA